MSIRAGWKVGKSREVAEKEKLDLTTAQAVDVPTGPVLKNKEFVYTMTLHDLDVAQSRAGTSVFSLFSGARKGRRSQLKLELAWMK